MFAPLCILSSGATAPPTSDRTTIALRDYAGINIGMSQLTNNVPAQAPYAAVIKQVIPPDGSVTYMRSPTYGIGPTTTNSYPVWNNSGSSYWRNMYLWAPPGDFTGGYRQICVEPLAGYLNAGMGPTSAPFGRNSDKSLVLSTNNPFRDQIRWRHRVLFSTDVGAVRTGVTQADIDAARITNAACTSLVGPNEIDHVSNWKYYYLNYTVQPDEITTATPFASISIVDTIFNGNLNLLFLRIVDHMRWTYEAINDSLAVGGAGRTNVGCIMPSVIKASRAKGTSNFTIYDIVNFEDMSANVGLRAGDWFQWVDAGQVHIHVNHCFIENPWDANPVGLVEQRISPYHYWRAKLDNEAYRAGLGLQIYPRPLVQGETGVPVQGDGIPLDWRPALNQFRRIKYGLLNAGNLFYACTMMLTYSVGNSGNYGYNLTDTPNVSSIATASIDTGNRGTGYAVNTLYSLNAVSTHPATFMVTSVGAGGSITGIRMNMTGYYTTIPAANSPLVTPTGGTAARLNLTFTTPTAYNLRGDLGTTDAAVLREVIDYRAHDISQLPSLGNFTYQIPIVAKTWKDYYKGWVVWADTSQNPIDDIASAQLMTNRAHIPNVTETSGSNRNIVFRTTYWVSKRSAMTAVQLIYSNSYLDATGEHDGKAVIFITSAVEYNGVTTPVTFSGAREVQIAVGGLATSDLITFSVPANTQFFVRHNVRTANASEKHALGYTTRTDWGEGWSLSTPAAQVDTTGVLVGNGSLAMFPCAAVLGASNESNPPRVIIIGSSSAFGQGEDFATIPMPGDRGYLSRLISNNYGQSVLVCPSNTLQQWITTSTRRMALINAIRPTHIINQLGTNDVIAGVASATVNSQLQTMWTQLAGTGAKVIQTTFTPTSTGTFTTVVGQTPTQQTIRNAVNAFIRTIPSPLSGILDACAVVESSPGSGVWRVDGGAWTTDGTHTTRHAEVAAALSLSVIS